jgi:hypothetical protein
MRFPAILLLGAWMCVSGAHAALPDHQVFPAAGERLLLWVAAERGRAGPELEAARRLAERGVEVWSLDATSAYFLPQLASSMDAVPAQDLAEWLRAARSTGKQVVVYAVARAAVPVLRAAALLEPGERQALCVLLMYPNLYRAAEALAEPDYLAIGSLAGLPVRVLQPRRSAATPWLPGLSGHLRDQGAVVSSVILENLRESFWARDTPTEFETAEGGRMDAMLVRELNQWGCK